MVRIPPVDEMFGQEATPKEMAKYYPSQSAKSLLKYFSELNPPTHLDTSHPTTNFSADQMIQFARAVGLEVSVASDSMLEDLLLKAGEGSRAYPVTSRYPAGRSIFPRVVGSSMGDSVASRSDYSLPTITETEGTDVIVSGDVVEIPCSSRQADARLAMGSDGSEKPGTDILETLQQIKASQKKKKKSRSCKWSGKSPVVIIRAVMRSRRRCYSSLLSSKRSQLVLKIRKYCVYCMLCRRNNSIRTRGLYELKRHFQRECYF